MATSDLHALRAHLRRQARPEVATSLQRFFKYPVPCYGIPAAELKKIARDFAPKNQDKTALWIQCTSLWRSQYQEEALIACEWALRMKKHYSPEDFSVFEDWMQNEVKNWATCDTLGNHPIGTLLLAFPSLLPRLREWARSPDLWLKRGAAVSLIVPARKGLYLKEALEIANLLWEDENDLVQKGYGWLLKTHTEKFPEEVIKAIEARKNTMPRTALRYAIEKLDPITKKIILQ
jgi:3-methyladenine DNA glycosylase AlkD